MKSQRSSQPDTIDGLLTVLADQHSRAVLSHFAADSDDVCSLRELTEAVSEHDQADSDRLALQLHHSTLPRLDEAGALEYDDRSRTIRYRGHSALQALMDRISTLG